MSRIHLAIWLAILVVFSLQKAVAIRLDGTARELGSYAASISLLALITALAALGKRQTTFEPGTPAHEESHARWVVRATLALVALNAVWKELYGFVAAPRFGPKPWVLVVVALLGMAWAIWVRRRGPSPRRMAVGLALMVVGVRAFILSSTPFDQVIGDMLATIDRSLDRLLAGDFPYVNFPPPMPYWPALFLSYVPPKLAGVDLRITNLTLDAMLVLFVSRKQAWTLALLLLCPTWTYYSINTQFSPVIFTAVLLVLSMTRGGPALQGLAFGTALATNPSFAAFGPILAAWWWNRERWHGLTIGAATAAGTLLAWLSPFLAWNSEGFLRVTLGMLGPMSADHMAGQITLWPLVNSLPALPEAISLAAVLVGTVIALRAKRSSTVVGAMAVSYTLVLMMVPRSFPHYYLPVLAILAAAETGKTQADPLSL